MFNNDVSDFVQVKKLIGKVEKMPNQTATGYSTSELCREAESAAREEQERQTRRRRRPAGEDEAGNSSGSDERQIQPARNRTCESKFALQSLWKAACSPKVLRIIKPFVAAILVGVIVGAAFGALVPLAAVGAAGLVVGSLSLAGTTALGVGAATGALVGGAIGANVAAEAESPSEAAKETAKQVFQVGVVAVGGAAVAGGIVGTMASIHTASSVAAVGAKLGSLAFLYSKVKTTSGEGPGSRTTEEEALGFNIQ